MSAATANYTIPSEPGRWGSLSLAIMMHLALLGFFWVGIRWQNETPVVVEAEVWDSKIAFAAPKPLPPPVVEAPAPAKPEPKAEPKAEQKVEAKVEPKPETPTEVSAPDIALERKRKLEKERKEQKLAEIKEQKELKKIRAKEKEKELAKEQAKEQAKELAKEQAKALAKEKLAEKEKLKQQERFAKRDAIEKQRTEKLQLEVNKQDELKRNQLEQAAAEKLRTETMNRMLGNGPANATGDAPRSTGPRGDPNYAGVIQAKIKSNLLFGGDTNVPGNPKVIFKISQLPNGEIIGTKMIKSSGIPAFDDAVEKAIAKSSPLPKKKDGSVERDLEATFNLKE